MYIYTLTLSTSSIFKTHSPVSSGRQILLFDMSPRGLRQKHATENDNEEANEENDDEQRNETGQHDMRPTEGGYTNAYGAQPC